MGLKGELEVTELPLHCFLQLAELADGSRYYFDPQEASKVTFLYFAKCMDSEYKRETRPEPPDLIQAVADAKDRREALSRVMRGSSFLALDQEALIARAEFVHPSLLVGHEYDEHGVLQPTQSE
jgi:hypothetical protein